MKLPTWYRPAASQASAISFVPSKRRIGLDIPQHRRARHQIARFVAAEDRRQIEPEAVYVHRLDPVAETVHDHPADDGMIGVERVSRAAVIGVARAILFEDVVGAVVQTAETQRRPAVVAFGGVIEDNVENDLDAAPGAAP